MNNCNCECISSAGLSVKQWSFRAVVITFSTKKWVAKCITDNRGAMKDFDCLM